MLSGCLKASNPTGIKRRIRIDRAQGHNGTGAQRHKGTEAQRHKGTKAQRQKGTKAKRQKGSVAQSIAVNLRSFGIKVSPPFFKEGWPDHKII